MIVITIIFVFLSIIPVPEHIFEDRLYILKVLGGSASILYVIIKETCCQKTSFLLLTCLGLSNLSVFLCMGQSLYAWGSLFFYLCTFFLPIDFVFIFLLILRSMLFGQWGLSLLMLLGFLVAFKRLRPIKFCWSFYLLSMWILFFLVFPGGDPLLFLIPVIVFPFSGALFFYFLFLARSAKEHLATTLLYVTNTIFVGLIFEDLHATLILLSCILLLFLILLIRIQNKNNRLEEFPHEFELFFKKKENKEVYLVVFYGLLLFFINFYCTETNAHFWLQDWVFSFSLQLIFITLFLQILKKNS